MTLKTRPFRLKLLSQVGLVMPGAKVKMTLTKYQTDGPDVVKLVWPLTEEPANPGFYSGPAWPNTRGEGDSQYVITADAGDQRMQALLHTVVDGDPAVTVAATMMVNPEPWPPVYQASAEVDAARVFSEAAGESAGIANAAASSIQELSIQYEDLDEAVESTQAAAAVAVPAASAALAAQAAAEAAANATRYATKALLDADLVPAAGAFASVYADPTPANNGLYYKVGATGAGSWQRYLGDRVTLVETRLTVIEDGVRAATAVGRPLATPPVNSGVVLSSATYAIGPLEHDTVFDTLIAGAVGADTLKVRVMDKTGDNFARFGGADVANLALVAGVNTKPVSFSGKKGQYIAFFHGGNLARTVTLADGQGWYSGAGDVNAFTDATLTTNQRIEISVIGKYVAVSAQRADAADAAIGQLQATQGENTLQVGAMPIGSQVIGRPAAPVTGLSSSAGTYSYAVPVVANGILRRIPVFALLAGTIKVKRYKWKNNNFTLVAELSVPLLAGASTPVVNWPVKKGELLAFFTPDNVVTRIVAPADGYGYYFGGVGDVANFTTSNRLTSNQFQIAFEIEFNEDYPHVVDIASSDRIVVLGDSHVEDAYTIRGKAWPAKLSAISDWAFENFGKSGDKASDVLSRIRTAALTFGTLPYAHRGAIRAWIYAGQNDAGVAGYPLATFLDEMRKLLETVRGLGAIPTLSTQHTDTYGVGSQVLFRNLAERHGAHFVDVTPNCRAMDYGARYAGHWGLTHHGTRTNEEIIPPFEDHLREIGQPRQSLKVFRKRNSVVAASAADLYFDTHDQRAALFREILIGQNALKVADEKYVDELNGVGGPQIEAVNSEYMQLQNGGTIAVPDWSLVEVVLPVLHKQVDLLWLILSEPGASVYVRNSLGAITAGKPVGDWRQIYGSNGRFSLSKDELRSAMRLDKVSFLVYKAGGIAALEQPRIEWYGEMIPKPALPHKTSGTPAQGAELLAVTDLGSMVGWDVHGSLGALAPGVPVDGLPRGCTGCITVDSANYVSRTFAYEESTTEDREIEIRVRCRYAPALVSSAAPELAQVTQDSYDYKTLQVELETAAGAAPYTERVGMFWKDVVFRSVAPMLTNSMTIAIKGADGPIRAAVASVRFVNP